MSGFLGDFLLQPNDRDRIGPGKGPESVTMKSIKRKPAAVRHDYCVVGIAPAGSDKAGNIPEEATATVRKPVMEVP